MNRCTIYGRLGADVETKNTAGGTLAKMRVATSERKKDQTGAWQDHTEWHNVVCFGKTADNCARFLAKGREVLVEGRLATSSWESDGVKRYRTEIIASRVTFVGGRGEDRPASRPATPARSSAMDMGDIPF